LSLWGRAFAALYDRALAEAERHGLADARAALLAQASGRTLEVGAGTGLNLRHYPAAVTELVMTEPEEPMAVRLERTLAAAGRAATVVRAPAEALPFPDGRFDTVVSTLVLCTVDDPARALDEIARVLRPGGRLLVLEHVRSGDAGSARWQDRLAPAWRAIGHGCRCNQDTGALLRASGLDVERLDAWRMPKAPPITRPAIVGSAVAR